MVGVHGGRIQEGCSPATSGPQSRYNFAATWGRQVRTAFFLIKHRCYVFCERPLSYPVGDSHDVSTTMRLPVLLPAGLALLPCLATGQSNASAPVVDLGYAKYVGYTNATTGIHYYRGLRYAVPPVGALRWQKPVPIESSSAHTGQTIQATQQGPACIPGYPAWEYAHGDPAAAGQFGATPQGASEDCLLLDVLVPAARAPVPGGLPVMVQIHGGGYTTGHALSYPGDAMTAAAAAGGGGLVYVAIQYRLGVFGFLGGSGVATAAGAGAATLNAGLHDQRLALEWVQRHAAAFGGDPARVTIWGGSAGGGSVAYQLMANGGGDGGAPPPFRAAIAEYPWWQPLLDGAAQERQYGAALAAAGCADLACLRGLSAAALARVGQRDLNGSFPGAGAGYGTFWFGPVVDGRFVRALPGVAFRTGAFHRVPLLLDREGYEGVGFSNASQTSQVDETTDAANLFPSAGPAFFSRLYELYPRSAYNSTFFQRQSWFGDFIINCPTYQMATSAVDGLQNRSSVFKLIFDAGTQKHGATAPFLVSQYPGWPGANNQSLAAIMTSYWISFATTMDPNPLRAPDAPFWPSYVSGGAGTAAEGESVGFEVLDITYGGISTGPDPDARVQCEFFLNKGYTLRN